MPRAATLVASARKKSVRSTRTTASDPRSARVSRRPALRLVTSRKPAARPAPAARTGARTVAARASTRPAAARQSTARVNGGSPTRATAPAALRSGASALRASGPAITYDKNDLLKRFAPLVRHVVERVAATLPRNVDHEDLYSAGMTSHASVNLMLALENEFDVEFPDRMLRRSVFENVASIRLALVELCAEESAA